jgi:membrane-bound serine protease (ClpP class)
MAAKRLNDAVAYIRGLALLRGRNVEWAERAVRQAVSLTAAEALQQQVVDLTAVDVPELLRRIDGRVVQVQGRPGAPGRELRLATAGASLVQHELDARGRLLTVLSDPSVALVLMMIGIYGLLFEFMSPGFVLPGVVGGVCLLLGLYGLQTLPVNGAGLALLLLGIAFLVAEAFVPSFGALGLGGIVAFAFGALMLFDTDVPGFGVPLELVAALTLVSTAFLVGVVGMAARARRRPQVSGIATLAGESGALLEVEGLDGREGYAEIRGERWHVRGTTLRVGQRVRVARVDGLTLDVEPAPETAAESTPRSR